MTTDDCKEWSCGTCTYLNKPLFLSCEMCGQDRPSQRPSPPRRQPSLNVDVSERNSSERRRDRAPRSVQRHRSTVNITGTLIMTDDPADYETQDGKKPGEDDEAEQDTPHLPPTREDDPTLDESMERHMLAPSRSHDSHGSSINDAYHSRRSQYGGRGIHRTNSNESGSIEFPPRRHTYQAPSQLHQQPHHQYQQQQQQQQQYHQGPPPTRKPYGSAGGSSNQTLPTAYMSSSSSRLQLEDSSCWQDDASSLSSGRSGRYYSNGSSAGMGNSSRRLVGQTGRPRLVAAPSQEIHYHGRSSNGLPVITREPYYHPHQQRRTSNGGSACLMGDTSLNSHYSQGSSHDSSSVRSPVTPRGTRRPSMGMGAAASMRHISVAGGAAGPGNPRASAMRRGSSVRELPAQGDFIESVLPSLAPPPVPTMDSPGDVDVMAVFVRDHQAAAQLNQNRRKSANEARKDRGKMLDNLSRTAGFASNTSNQSNRSLGMGAGSGISLASSSRRLLQPTSQRGLSTRLLGGADADIQEEADEEGSAHGAALQHPSMMQDTEALDSPNTRKERRKEKRRMKGAVRTLMATMRIASVTNK